jgi:MFS family permease
VQPSLPLPASDRAKVEIESMGSGITPVIALAFTGFLLMIVFAFVSVVIWADARRKERESLYRNELLKKLADTPGPGAETVLASLREEEQRKRERRRGILALGGWLCVALGLAVLAGHFLTPDTRHDGAWALCFVPLFLGAVLIGHARLVMRRISQ